jgi:ABC-type dipeptide/oligopeptide/nickel transport system permease component
VEATVFVIAMLIMLLNLVVDLAYAYVNPRISYQ